MTSHHHTTESKALAVLRREGCEAPFFDFTVSVSFVELVREGKRIFSEAREMRAIPLFIDREARTVTFGCMRQTEKAWRRRNNY